MKKNIWLWIISIILTLSIVFFQRLTGPTYPITGSLQVGSQPVSYRLERSHTSGLDYIIKIQANATEVKGHVMWRKFPSEQNWIQTSLLRDRDILQATLPRQQALQKLEYKVMLEAGNFSIYLNNGQPVIMRFKNHVPWYWLVPHIILMFGAMLFAVRAGLGVLAHYHRNLYGLTLWTTILLCLGGIVFGCVVQYYAFGVWWSGFPFGYDLTDTKTLIALIAWCLALWRCHKDTSTCHKWIFIAWIITILIYCVPHSV